jgi:hypothetical protein
MLSIQTWYASEQRECPTYWSTVDATIYRGETPLFVRKLIAGRDNRHQADSQCTTTTQVVTQLTREARTHSMIKYSEDELWAALKQSGAIVLAEVKKDGTAVHPPTEEEREKLELAQVCTCPSSLSRRVANGTTPIPIYLYI